MVQLYHHPTSPTESHKGFVFESGERCFVNRQLTPPSFRVKYRSRIHKRAHPVITPTVRE